MFNNNYINFMDGVKKLLKDDDNIFNKIKGYNNTVSIFPENENITKLKFDDDILTAIFGDVENKKLKIINEDILKDKDDKIICWTFKDLKRISKTHLIYRDMLEKTFNKQIIISKKDKHNNTKFSISENNKKLVSIFYRTFKTRTKKTTTENNNLLDVNINVE